MVLIPLSNEAKAQEKLEKKKMFVIKRDGRKEPVMFDKITSRIQKLCYGLNMDYIDPPSITLKVIMGVYSGVSTIELDNLAAETAVLLSNDHPDYAILAARIETSNLHKETKKTFSEVVDALYNAGQIDGSNHEKMDKKIYESVKKNEDVLNSSIIYDRDFSFSYFAIKTLENYFLKKINGKIVERPQHMLMRMAIAIHCEDIGRVVDMYNKLSRKMYTHSPSTMRNAGFINGQILSDCCLTMKSDSIEGIFETLKDFSLSARADLQVGLNIHCIRAKGSYIAGTNGKSNGLVPMLRVYDSKVKAISKKGTKESAALTIFIEPWHADIYDFLALKRTTGKHEHRAKELVYALWIPDLFMKRVRENEEWCLMSPNDCEQLESLWGVAFEEQYTSFEKEQRFVKKVKARHLWEAIYDSQMNNGGPLLFYKDNCNSKSNQQNLGSLLSSSYSGEAMLFTSSEEAPVSGSATICLDAFVKSDKTFDFEQLKDCVKVVTRTLDKMIDVSTYPLESSRVATLRHRPIAIGVQGLADALILMRYPFESPEAKVLNKHIFETVYYGAVEESCEMAKSEGSYPSYEGSPISRGVFQFDLWDVTPTSLHDWAFLKEKVARWGVRNSLMVACRVEPLSALIQGCTQGIEPIESNFQIMESIRKDLKVVNRHLLRDLMDLGLWDNIIENRIKENEGSVQDIDRIPDYLRALYKTGWEVSQKSILDLAAERGPFIDQSQSLNLYVTDPNYGKFSSMHFFAWKSGLKTGVTKFYTKASHISSSMASKVRTSESVSMATTDENDSKNNLAAMVCSLENRDECLACGS